MALSENSKLKNIGLQAKTPSQRRPRMVAYIIPREMAGKKIISSIEKKNRD